MPLIADPEYFAETIRQLADWARPREPELDPRRGGARIHLRRCARVRARSRVHRRTQTRQAPARDGRGDVRARVRHRQPPGAPRRGSRGRARHRPRRRARNGRNGPREGRARRGARRGRRRRPLRDRARVPARPRRACPATTCTRSFSTEHARSVRGRSYNESMTTQPEPGRSLPPGIARPRCVRRCPFHECRRAHKGRSCRLDADPRGRHRHRSPTGFRRNPRSNVSSRRSAETSQTASSPP